jgi:hypothetical protein
MKRSNWIVAAMFAVGSAATSTMLMHSPRDGARDAAARLRFATVTPRAVATQSPSAAVCDGSGAGLRILTRRLGSAPVEPQETRGQHRISETPVEVARRSAVSPAGIWSVSERGAEAKTAWIGRLARWHGVRVDGRFTRQRWELDLVQRILGQRTAAPTSSRS